MIGPLKLLVKNNILTIFLVLECGQEHHKNNGITSGPISPRVPSGLILENWGTFVVVFHFARSLIS